MHSGNSLVRVINVIMFNIVSLSCDLYVAIYGVIWFGHMAEIT